MRVPWTARRSNQSILKEISLGCSLEGLMKLKLQYFGHLMQRTDSFEKTLKLGKIEGRRRQGQQRMRWLDGWMADYIIQNSRMDEAQAGIKIAADDDCSHEIKRRLLLGRKVMTNLDSILKSREIILPTKVHLVKAVVFPVVVYCES